MIIEYLKTGNVEVAAPGAEPLMMKDPVGRVQALPVVIEDGMLKIQSIITDAVPNKIGRDHPVQMDLPAKQAWVEFFFKHAARLAKDQYPEFVGLELTDVCQQSLIAEGIDLSFLAEL